MTGDVVQRVLRERFGFPSLRPGQGEVVADVLAGRPVVAVMPTGAGKSLCYQLPAVILGEGGGVALVVSPLIALMKDQVDGLRARGVATAALTSAADLEEQHEILDGLRAGTYDLIYVAPERFQNARFCDALSEVADRLALLAIDEAHCISEWGHEFRPAYRQLGEVIQRLRPPRVVALTATATPQVRADIAEQLGLRDPALHVHGFSRDNLTFTVEHTGGPADKGRRLAERVRMRPGGVAIVYAATRKNAERYAEDLREAGMRAGIYHAGLDDERRRAAQDDFMADRLDVLVATNAFGMGVDKTDIRLVVHADLPRSVEAYYQEAGRAGRDGQPAECVLLFNHGDVRLQEFLIDASYPSAEILRATWRVLRERPDLGAPEALRSYLPGQPHASVVSSAQRILGRHGYLAEMQGMVAAVRPADLPGEHPPFDPEASERRGEVERGKLRKMIDYAYHAGCRHRYVLDYFGDRDAAERERCDACDNCQGRGSAREAAAGELDDAAALLGLVAELSGRFGRTRLAALALGNDDDDRFLELPERGCLRGRTRSYVLDLLRALETAGLIEVSRGDYPTLGVSARGRRIAAGHDDIDAGELRLTARAPRRRRTAKPAPAAAADAGDLDPELVERLRQLRHRLAGDRAVPAYVVFSNRTLEDIARQRPADIDELARVHGIGPSRLEEFGEDILAALR